MDLHRHTTRTTGAQSCTVQCSSEACDSAYFCALIFIALQISMKLQNAVQAGADHLAVLFILLGLRKENNLASFRRSVVLVRNPY